MSLGEVSAVNGELIEALTEVEIVMTEQMWQTLSAHLLPPAEKSRRFSPDEQLAFLLASSNAGAQRQRLLVREMLPAGADDLVCQGPAEIAPTPAFVLQALNRCKQESLHLIEVHSHPFSQGAGTTFSNIDWGNDRKKMPSLATLLDNFFHATMVMGQDSLDAHFYDRATRRILPVSRVVIVGTGPLSTSSGLRIYPTSSALKTSYPDEPTLPHRYHRQELFFGSQTQRQLARTTVAIVGLGGLGSFVALELAHLGIGHLMLIDGDTIEETNLNRLPGVGVAGIGQSKVSVYATFLKQIAPAIQIEALPYSIMEQEALTAARGADILAGCVDNHGARMILNQLAIRYLIPLIDGGSGFKRLSETTPLTAGGQIQAVLPGIGCLECRGFIDMQRATFDLASPEAQAEERAHGYGLDTPAPSVISLNGVIASAMVTEILLLLANIPGKVPRKVPPISLYNAFDRTLVPIEPHASSVCPTCGSDGVLGIGDLAPIHIQASRQTATADEIPHHLISDPLPDRQEITNGGETENTPSSHTVSHTIEIAEKGAKEDQEVEIPQNTSPLLFQHRDEKKKGASHFWHKLFPTINSGQEKIEHTD